MSLDRKKRDLTADELRSLLSYDPNTGIFRWASHRGRNSNFGQIAGNWCRGRLTIGVLYFRYEAGILAWLFIHGKWPDGDIDHIDRDPSNNRLDNLREASRSQNCMNQTARKNSESGLKGISRTGTGRWQARISGGPGVRYNLGVFKEKEHAAAVYRIAAAGIHGEFSGV